MRIDIPEYAFPTRKNKDKKQVRFWANKELYAQFKGRCAQNGTYLQDAFMAFMMAYVKAPPKGSDE